MNDIEINLEQQNIDADINQITEVQTTNHNELNNLSYSASGHTGFQKEIDSSNKLGADLIEESTNKVFVSQSEKSDIALNTTSRHTHLNKSVLDTITQETLDKITTLETSKVDKVTGKGLSTNDLTNELKSNYDSAYNDKHTHSNKILLDTYDQTNLDITDAVEKKHSHSNKSALDNVSQSLLNKIGSNESNINTINDKIPSQATSSNKLADKDFVNSSVATNTAYFLGTLDVVTDLGLSYGASTSDVVVALNSYTFVSKTNNDYCFVINKDNNNTIYQRYKWNTLTFLYEYSLNNSSFTANQWNAINSGISSNKVSSYDTHIASTSNPHSVTKSQVGLGNVDNTSDLNKPISTATQTALNGKQATIDTNNKLSASLVSGLSTAATSGSYNDLTNKPVTLPVTFTTTEPTSANTNGLIVVYLNAEPTTKYSGYIYMITES